MTSLPVQELVEEKTQRRIKHVMGWRKETALCGAPFDWPNGPPKPRPFMPDCVVCWDIWTRMDGYERDVLWALARARCR